MITLALLLTISFIVLSLAFVLVATGGSLFLILAGDIIVAVFVIWLLYKLIKSAKKKGSK